MSYAFTDPRDNVSWVFGLGAKPQRLVPPPLYLAVMMAILPLAIYLPTHRVLRRLFRAPRI